MTVSELMTEYARLLRLFYCNPSNAWVRLQVAAFEREHGDVLDPFWRAWQDRATEGHAGARLEHTCICRGFYRNRHCTALKHPGDP